MTTDREPDSVLPPNRNDEKPVCEASLGLNLMVRHCAQVVFHNNVTSIHVVGGIRLNRHSFKKSSHSLDREKPPAYHPPHLDISPSPLSVSTRMHVCA